MDFIFVRFRKCPKILSSIVYNNVKYTFERIQEQ